MGCYELDEAKSPEGVTGERRVYKERCSLLFILAINLSITKCANFRILDWEPYGSRCVEMRVGG
jgi:hypothetical protein